MLKKILAVLVMLYAAVAMAAVDVNKASEAELDGVKGIGPVTSKLILSERKKSEFKSWEDFIARVKGVGDAKATQLSAEGLTVNGSLYKATAAKKEDKQADAAKSAAAAAAKPAAAAAPAASAAKPAASAKK
ncbi:helix-hairpin-helix domain-containing protein [uncultured Ramlibacter sp.]|uniref:ComEA family DNA-binding protein n=1 Tax=uncultured Ramlibacter sp. TaxID=260755 RepID=UPI0026309125|nr:helix-hairpin-helix domain-containing protein [uncultured Ramlibacter sp.]